MSDDMKLINKSLTKEDIAIAVGAKLGMSKTDCKKVVNCILDSMVKSIKRDKILKVKGFGTFKVKTRKPKVGRNPVTMEEKKIPERDVVVFNRSNWDIV